MEQVIQSPTTEISFERKSVEAKTATSGIWDYLEFNRFGFTPLILVSIVSLGGIAAATALGKSMALLLAVALTSGIVEAMLIAIVSMRMIFWWTVVALLFDLIVFVTI